jgi:hypothetical protein
MAAKVHDEVILAHCSKSVGTMRVVVRSDLGDSTRF